MPSKYEIISALASQEAVRITSDVAQYEAFLVTAANNYKYTFREQLLIHAQKPEATACAEIKLWNKLGRWVNGGTKGIALLVEGRSGYKLRYVFDYSDTNSRVGRTITLWQLQPQFEAGVIEAMANSVGDLTPDGDFVQSIMQFTETLVDDNFTDYRDMLMEVKGGSLLEELDELNTEVWLKNLLKSSVAFMALTRCGYDARLYLDADDFQHLREFNTQEVVSVLGGASSDIAEMALREIEATVRALGKAEKTHAHTFAQSPSLGNNGLDNTERSDLHGPDLSHRGRLSAPEPDRAGGPEDREVWNAAAKLPEGAQGPDLHRDAPEREAELASGGDRPEGRRDDGTTDHADGTVGGRDGEPESDGPDEVGGDDEQHPAEGRGDGDGGADLRLSQESTEAGPAEEPPSVLDFSDFDPDDLRGRPAYFHEDSEKRELIRTSPALKDHRVEIAAFFASHQEVKERCDFIKGFFTNEVYETTLSNGQPAGYRAYDDLLRLFRGSFNAPEKEDNIRWSYVASIINGMMVMHEWLDPDEAPLPSEGEQISIIQEAQAEKKADFEVPQEAIDYVLVGGAGIRNSKLAIFEQFQKGEEQKENVAFLKNLYGIGGRSDAIPGSGIWEDHDTKGITLRRRNENGSDDFRVTLTWVKVEKRIRELIAADRYFNRAELEAYPGYLLERDKRELRGNIAEEFMDIIKEYKATIEGSGKTDLLPDQYYLIMCGHAFLTEDKKIHVRSIEGDFIIPMMRQAMETIIGQDTFLTERCQAMLEHLNSDMAKALEPTEEELNPPRREYRFEVGNHVYLGEKEYEILTLGEETVRLSDCDFPIITTELPFSEFEEKVRENRLNDHLQADEDDLEDELEENDEDDELRFQVIEADRGHKIAYTIWDDAIGEPYIDENGNEVEFDSEWQAEDYAKKLNDRVIEAPTLPKGSPMWQEYSQIKKANPDALLLFEVGDFFEALGEDAKTLAAALNLNLTSRELGLEERVPMCGIPGHNLDTVIMMLHDRNLNVAIATLQKGEREVVSMPSQHEGEATESLPVGRIDYLANDGKVEYSIEYLEQERLIAAVKEDTNYGIPMTVVLYRDKDGNTIPQDFLLELDPPPKGFKVEDEKVLTYDPLLEEAKTIINQFCESEYGSPASFDKLDEIGVGFTTLTDEEIPIQIYVNLLDCSLDRYLSNSLLESRKYDTLQELIDHELKNLYFADLIDVTDEQIAQIQKQEEAHDELDDIDPAWIRARLEEHGIVNGEVVDPEKLENAPFIQQVTADVERIAQEQAAAEKTQVSEDLIGKKLELDGHQFVVEEVGEISGDVRLFDQTMADQGYPISRVEKIDTIRQLLTQAEKKEEVLEPPKPHRTGKVAPTVLLPEIPMAQRHDFQITDDAIGVGTPSERFNRNVAAIRLLKKLEEENRLATPDEQAVLAQYVGWGGLADCFDDRHSKFGELKALLTEVEYDAARESALTAFYTPPQVIRAMYQGLEQIGFKRGNLLEPSCGIGHFMGMRPETLADSKIYGIELDSISGRIAQQLYQKSSIAVQGFENTDLPDSFFDVAIGNIPFGNFKLMDKRYDKHNFLIHDYFFAKTLDKVRPGGIIAFITSKGTLDKDNPSFRKYMAQRADLLGAIRLPNNTFKDAAGTDVTSDILFFQKRDTLAIDEPDWVHLGMDANGLKMNQYFIDNPDMILGEMKEISGPFGPETACIANDGVDLGEQLLDAVQNINGSIEEYEDVELEEDEEDLTIPADPSVRNFSFTVMDGKVYYRENSITRPVDASVTAQSRIKGLIGLRDCVRQLIEYQTENYTDAEIEGKQKELNTLYDAFVAKYGLINARANKSVFYPDNSYYLLSSLEVLDSKGNLERKADMFTKRTIKQQVVISHVDTASEALAISLAERAKVDMIFMGKLTDKTEEELFADLKGVIFLNPMYGYGSAGEAKYLTADEYLSGNVREKLSWAKRSAEQYPEDYSINVSALEAVQPVDLDASEISVRLGSSWIPPEIYQQFMYDLFDTPYYCRYNIKVHFSQYTGEWNIEGKSYDRGNIKAYSAYGTERINGYKILEQSLNLKDVRIFDYVEGPDGKRTPVINRKETAIAQAKQEQMKQAFQDWIWKDPTRRDFLTKLYNEKFNSLRPREYDGSHLSLPGINPEITLRQHQLNAVARGLYGGNELLAHVVGAGKTFTMVTIAQEAKRLGLCRKTMIVVPNHLTEQWASEYLQLYPSANILVATAKDFEAKNRKRFCGRIATGDYDAVIIGHSQLEKIPLSIERQIAMLEDQLHEIMAGIEEMKYNKGERFSVKQMQKTKKQIQAKLAKLNDQSRKDDVVTFEELGVDKLMIDEAHYYKNLAAFSKMRNVGGISQTEAQKSSDLYMKCRYLDDLTDGHGIVFATGTPISNTMIEMYTMQKYLQYKMLKDNGMIHFDCWASNFGETVTAIELAPEGTGYRTKTRFSRFFNLPELLAMFKEVADVQTADMLNLPVPKANYHTEVLKPSEIQKEMVAELAERAERVRNGMVNSSEDNMLVITNDGRKLALDQRLINELLPDEGVSKVSVCAARVFEIWERTAETRSTQMVFCDLSTPHNDGKFNVYDALKQKLMDKGVPAEEIAYVHEAKTEVQKKELFAKVRSGEIRVLIGSTQKMGAGTNVQQRLIALHHLDCPWRPADLQQREGRIIRQGNENPEVEIYTYVTENTFDAYLYQLVEGKQKFIGQVMTSKSPVRSAEDIDETALSYAEIKALCSGNPEIKEKMDLDVAVQKLKLIKASHLSQKYALEDKIIKDFPKQISTLEQRIAGYKTDIATCENNTHPGEDNFCPMEIKGTVYTDKKEAGTAILDACKSMTNPDPIIIGKYRGFEMELFFESFSKEYRLSLKGAITHTASLGTDVFGNLVRIDNTLSGLDSFLKEAEAQLENVKVQLENAKIEVEKPFPQEEELNQKLARLNELNIKLNMDKRENEIADGDGEEPDEQLREKAVPVAR